MKTPSFPSLGLFLFGWSAFTPSTRAGEAATWHVFQYEHVLGTSLDLRFVARSDTAAASAESAALAEIDRLARILSSYDPASEFSRWQATRGVATRVSSELFEVLALFDAWRDRTDGALDASAEVAGRLWKAAAQQQRVPSANEIATVVAAVCQTHWRLDAATQTATHLSDAPLILNSFAKSYIIERASAAALAAGPVETAVVNIGGDLVVRGAAADTIAIADPEADAENDAPLTQIAVQNRAVATSGSYRRGVDVAGRWYSHLVDPRTGLPVDHVRSATVVAPRATDAGALATALCVMPPEAGMRLAATVRDVECLLITSDGSRIASAGWSGIETVPPPAATNWVQAVAARPGSAPTARSASTWDPAYELSVNLELATLGGGRARKPFVAVWIEDKEGFSLRTLALWYHGARWLPDLRAWNHADQLRLMTGDTRIVESVSSATRGPGKYLLKWDGRDGGGQLVSRGKYTVAIEVAREHGTHQVMRQEVDFTGEPGRFDFPSNLEVAAASLAYRRKSASP